jgi:hypothetical protein
MPSLDEFYRLFLVPGMAHCALGPGAFCFGFVYLLLLLLLLSPFSPLSSAITPASNTIA